MKPLAIDLFCGLGGWAAGFLAEGYRVVGFDNDPRFAKLYPGEFVLADVRTLDGRRFRDARVIVASPPCQEFSGLRFLNRHMRKRLPDTSLADTAFRIGREAGVPLVLENVAGARDFIGPSRCHRGPWHLWGDVPLLPSMRVPPKLGEMAGRNVSTRGEVPMRLRQWGHRDNSPMGAANRARIYKPLARAVARAFL